MAIVVKGKGDVKLSDFSLPSDPEGFNKFKMERDCAYYLMPEQEIDITNPHEEELIVFIANCDI
jgi:hypothetical protein